MDKDVTVGDVVSHSESQGRMSVVGEWEVNTCVRVRGLIMSSATLAEAVMPRQSLPGRLYSSIVPVMSPDDEHRCGIWDHQCPRS